MLLITVQTLVPAMQFRQSQSASNSTILHTRTDTIACLECVFQVSLLCKVVFLIFSVRVLYSFAHAIQSRIPFSEVFFVFIKSVTFYPVRDFCLQPLLLKQRHLHGS